MAEKTRLIPAIAAKRSRSLRSALVLNIVFCLLSLYLIKHAYESTKLSKDPHQRALRLMRDHPLIDGHVDVPINIRYSYGDQPYEVDFRRENSTSDVSIPALRKGHVGGFFWSLFVLCADTAGIDEGPDFIKPSYRVRDTLEQFDVARIMIERYKDTFQFADSAADVRKAFKAGKIASLFGLEGAHQIGNSLSVLRQYRQLGARYMTLTHTCNNAFADSCGYDNKPIEPAHNGVSSFGHVLVKEMNRIGMIVDVSHTSAKTAADALSISKAPIIFSHSGSRSKYDSVRNVPDYVLDRIGRADKGDTSETGVLAGDALIMANFVPGFLANGTATLETVADQVDYLGRKCGRSHVGIGSDFDGIGGPNDAGGRVIGLENVSKYPNLIAEMIRRGWTDKEVIGLMGGNLLRILDSGDAVAESMKHERAATEIYSKRTDIPKSKRLEL